MSEIEGLELLDLLMATELVNKAQSASNKEKVRKHPKPVRDLRDPDAAGDDEI